MQISAAVCLSELPPRSASGVSTKYDLTLSPSPNLASKRVTRVAHCTTVVVRKVGGTPEQRWAKTLAGNNFIGLETSDCRLETVDYGSASVNAAVAHPVAICEIHWSCSYGKPPSKYGWNFAARLFTYHDPSGRWLESRYAAPFLYAACCGAIPPASARAKSVSPVAYASLCRSSF